MNVLSMAMTKGKRAKTTHQPAPMTRQVSELILDYSVLVGVPEIPTHKILINNNNLSFKSQNFLGGLLFSN